MKKNTVASIINMAGVIEIIVGALAWFVMLCDGVAGSWIWLIVGAVSGMLFVGFAEIIDLLQGNLDKQDELLSATRNGNASSPSSAEFSDLPEL